MGGLCAAARAADTTAETPVTDTALAPEAEVEVVEVVPTDPHEESPGEFTMDSSDDGRKPRPEETEELRDMERDDASDGATSFTEAASDRRRLGVDEVLPPKPTTMRPPENRGDSGLVPASSVSTTEDRASTEERWTVWRRSLALPAAPTPAPLDAPPSVVDNDGCSTARLDARRDEGGEKPRPGGGAVEAMAARRAVNNCRSSASDVSCDATR